MLETNLRTTLDSHETARPKLSSQFRSLIIPTRKTDVEESYYINVIRIRHVIDNLQGVLITQERQRNRTKVIITVKVPGNRENTDT